MAVVRAQEIEEQVARAGGDGRVQCPYCLLPKKALCNIGLLEYEDGSSRACPNVKYTRCPTCAAPVNNIFDHIDRDCAHE